VCSENHLCEGKAKRKGGRGLRGVHENLLERWGLTVFPFCDRSKVRSGAGEGGFQPKKRNSEDPRIAAGCTLNRI